MRRRDHRVAVRAPSRQVILGRKRDPAQGTCRRRAKTALVAPLCEAARSEAVATSKLHRRGSDAVVRVMIVVADRAEHSVFFVADRLL